MTIENSHERSHAIAWEQLVQDAGFPRLKSLTGLERLEHEIGGSQADYVACHPCRVEFVGG
jgi:hypothetical protein